MKANVKFTGMNIASAMVAAFFMPWLNISLASFSGYALVSNAITPGMMGMFFNEISINNN